MSTSTKPLTAAQRNHRLVTRHVDPTWNRYNPTTERDEYDNFERDICRKLGKAVIDVRNELDQSGWLPQPLVRTMLALCEAADAAYQWHVGDPVPQEEAA